MKPAFPDAAPFAQRLDAFEIAAPRRSGPAHVCSNCRWRDVCLPGTLESDAVRKFQQIVRVGFRVKAGQHLFRVGDPLTAVYAIFSGQVKELAVTPSGRERIVSFPMAGELCGTASRSGRHYDTSVVALEDSDVCAIPVASLEEVSRNVPELQQRFHALLSVEIVRSHNLMLLLSFGSADARIAAFMLETARRYGQRGYSSATFHLRMTRTELGNYLGVKLETVSRVFSRFRKRGLLAIEGRQISILSRTGLEIISAQREVRARRSSGGARLTPMHGPCDHSARAPAT